MAGVGAGVGKSFPASTPTLVAGYHPSRDGDLGRAIMHRLENIERLEEKESGSVETKSERHLVI